MSRTARSPSVLVSTSPPPWVDQALDDPNLVRAQPTDRERFNGTVLREHDELLGRHAEAEHLVAQRVDGTGQERTHAVASGDRRARRAHVNPRRAVRPPAAVRRPRAWAPSRAA